MYMIKMEEDHEISYIGIDEAHGKKAGWKKIK